MIRKAGEFGPSRQPITKKTGKNEGFLVMEHALFLVSAPQRKSGENEGNRK